MKKATKILLLIVGLLATMSSVATAADSGISILTIKHGIWFTSTPYSFSITSTKERLPCRELSYEECHNNPPYEKNHGFPIKITITQDGEESSYEDVAIYAPQEYSKATVYYGSASKIYEALKKSLTNENIKVTINIGGLNLGDVEL